MAFDLSTLVTDRTQADVKARNAKGTYGAADLNRVGEAILFVRDKLLETGVNPVVNPKINWTDVDWMNPSQAAQYLGDLEELRSQYTLAEGTPETPKSMAGLTYETANNIEMILLAVYDQYLAILSSWVAAGPATCGGDYL